MLETVMFGIKGYEVWRYGRYVFDGASYRAPVAMPETNEALMDLAAQIRGREHGPALMIHGIMKRTGTVYVGELLRLHPELYAFPHNIWELPLLQMYRDVDKLQGEFLNIYEENQGKVDEGAFPVLLGAGMMAHLHAGTPAGKRVLMKEPSVQHLYAFPHMFPNEHLLVLVRDGRDVVESTVRTWPQIRFSFACLRWRRAAELVMHCDREFGGREGYWLARFEDAVSDPAGFVRGACAHFDLDEACFPFEKIPSLQVRGSSALKEKGRVSWDPQKPKGEFKPVGRWRSWPAHRRWLFKLIAGKALVGLGYSADNEW
jgi:hypothetical protein